MKKQIYVIRHGQTDYNVRQVVQGRGINSDLNETGIKQAQMFYQKYKHIPFDTVYTSSLKRTQQTVQYFFESIKHIQRHEIDEIDWGVFEGVEHHPSLHEKYYGIIESWKLNNLDNKIEGGESANELKNRIMPFYEEIISNSEENILVCTHGRTLRVLMCLFMNVPISEMDNFKHENTCLYQLSLNGKICEIIKANDLSHLVG